MPSRFVLASALACVLLTPLGRAFAHSNTIGVAAVVEDDDGRSVNVLRLHQGLAQRSGDSWHYICPSLYQGMGQDLAAALPGGGVAIAASTGIVVMARDGSIAPHPDPEAATGLVTAFAQGRGVLYALRFRSQENASDVLEIGSDKVRVLWSDSHYWSDLAVGTSFLQLVRAEQDTIWELQLSYQGEVLSQQNAVLIDVLLINTRVVGDVPYFIAKFEQSVELGQIEQSNWRVLQTATTNIAGPADTADGARFLALDGKLASMDAEIVTPRMDTDYVIGLGRLEDRAYACTRTGLRDLSNQGLGETLFDLAELQPPDPCDVPDAIRSMCNLEWQHVKVELLGANIPLAPDMTQSAVCQPTPTMVASPAIAAADGGVAGASSAAGAAGITSAPVMPIATAAPIASDGCNIGGQSAPSAGLRGYGILISLALFAGRRRATRR